MRRTSYLKRYAPPKKRREGKRRVSAVRSEAWKAEVRRLPCVGLPGGIHALDCRPHLPRDASHLGRDGGMGTKASDDTCVPHSRPCHDLWGSSRAWTQGERREWAAGVIAETQVSVTAQIAGVGGVFAW